MLNTIARYGCVDLLCIDGLGYMAFDRRGAEVLFKSWPNARRRFRRHRLQRVLLRLDQTSTDPRLCAAIVDRLIFGGTIIETGTDSYRLARTGQQLQ